jgi:predicted SpoU family rRNA methylase
MKSSYVISDKKRADKVADSFNRTWKRWGGTLIINTKGKDGKNIITYRK